MSKNSKNHNIIEASILTDVLNWKTLEKSYENLCEHFGDNTILIEDHQKLLNHYTRQTQFLLEAQTNVNDIVFNESMYLRYRILQYVISRCPIFISYKKVYRTMKHINYPEFEFWYFRFYNGQRDLNYDRSKDPKPLTFTDLPVDVIEKIVEKSKIKSRYILRKVSVGLRRLVDSSNLSIKKISILVDCYSISIYVDDVKEDLYYPLSAWFTTNDVPLQNSMNEVCSRLAFFIKNPKLQLGSLNINLLYDTQMNDMLDDLLKSLTHQLHVNNLSINFNRQQELVKFISRMKPKVLKKIEIRYSSVEIPLIHYITNYEQWKQAEEITIVDPITCDISHFVHFKNFDIYLKMVSIKSIFELTEVS